MASMIQRVGMMALATALVVGTVFSASALIPQPQSQTADAQGSAPGGAEGPQNLPGPEEKQAPAVDAVEPEPGPAPRADHVVPIESPGVPKDLIASWVDGSMILSWLDPAAGRASHYTVTRTHWDQEARVEVFTVDGPATRFVDDSVQTGVTYTYTVASNGDGHMSPPAAVMVTKAETVPQPVRALAQNAETTQIFNPGGGYDILTRYGSTTEILLADYLAAGAGEVTFSLKSCDTSSSDYYDSQTVENGAMVLESNTLGHVHGQNTEAATVCTVTGSNGTESEDQDFRLYTVADRTPYALLPGALSLVEARATGADVQITAGGGSLGHVRLGWRKAGGQPSFAVAWGVTDGTVLTIPGLEAGTQYEVRAYLMTGQAFDLYRAGGTALAGVLIPEVTPGSKWIRNLASGGLGKGQVITLSTATLPPPQPTMPPKPPVMEATPVPTPRPTPELEDDETDDGIDTPETDTDDDTPTPVTPYTPTPDPVTPDTPTPDPVTPDTPTPDTPTPDTPTPDTPTPDTPTPDTPTPDTPTPDTPTPDTPTPDTPTPDTPTPDTPTPDTPTPDTPTPDTPTPDTPTPDTPTPDTPTPDTPTPDTPTPDTPTPDTPTPDTPTPDTPTPDTPTPDTPTPDTPTPDTPTPDTPTPDTPTPDTPTPDTPTPDTPTPDTPDTPETDSDENS